jgi:uncharacterized damage-inducible protein DinB
VLADALRTLYGYTEWATGRLLEAAEHLTPEQLHRPGSAGHGSVRDTLLHLMRTQRSWLSWWDGSLPADEAYALALDPAAYPDVGALRALWADVARQTRAFTAGLTDREAARVFEHTLPNGFQFRMPLWQMMLHVANHGTQHRSEAAAMLTAFGHSPGDLEVLGYCLTGGGTTADGR